MTHITVQEELGNSRGPSTLPTDRGLHVQMVPHLLHLLFYLTDQKLRNDDAFNHLTKDEEKKMLNWLILQICFLSERLLEDLYKL